MKSCLLIQNILRKLYNTHLAGPNFFYVCGFPFGPDNFSRLHTGGIPAPMKPASFQSRCSQFSPLTETPVNVH